MISGFCSIGVSTSAIETVQRFFLIIEIEHAVPERRGVGRSRPLMKSPGQPGLFMRFRREGDEAPMPGGFSRLGARRRTRQYVEHPKAKMHDWRGCIVSRSRPLMKSPG
jgi:hypothetical protein